MRNIFSTLFFLSLCTASFAQISLNSINFQVPTSSFLSYNQYYSLGSTFKIKDKTKQVELSILGYNSGGSSLNSSTGSSYLLTYFDTATNSFTNNVRVTYGMQDGDSILTQGQSSRAQGVGLRIGLHREVTYGNIPFYTGIAASFIGTRLSYSQIYSYQTFREDGGNTAGYNFDGLQFNPWPVSSVNESKLSFTPQISVHAGVVLSLTEKIKIIPKTRCSVFHRINNGVGVFSVSFVAVRATTDAGSARKRKPSKNPDFNLMKLN